MQGIRRSLHHGVPGFSVWLDCQASYRSIRVRSGLLIGSRLVTVSEGWYWDIEGSKGGYRLLGW